MNMGSIKATGTNTNPERTSPHCPRCGYDQSGLIATWTASCPLEATCTECGYAFDPADAIEPTRRRLPWLYEHAKRPWSVRRWLRTALMLLWPPLFWKRVRPEHEVRSGRVVLWLVGPFAVLVLACAAMDVAVRTVETHRWAQWRNRPITWTDATAIGAREFWESLTTLEAMTRFAYSTGAVTFGMILAITWLPVAAAFIAIPSEWSGTRLRWAHLVRLLGYAAAPMFVGSIVFTLWNLANGVYTEVYYLLPTRKQMGLPQPGDFGPPSWVAMPMMLSAVLVWPALYWFSAIRWGYQLPSTLRPFLIVLAVLLTPWALYLAFEGYYTYIA
ncbi:MAG: hypothetical protein ACTS27_01670 [Phycisphaerales bacterium]